MSAADPCRACDGRGSRETTDKLNVIRAPKVSRCSRCQGSGAEPGPSKGGARRFGSKQPMDDEEMSLDAQASAFLARHGFNKRGAR